MSTTKKNFSVSNFNAVKANGKSAFPSVDKSQGTFTAQLISLEEPDNQEQWELDNKHKFVIKSQIEGHTNSMVCHWVTFNYANDEAIEKSTKYFAYLANSIADACGQPLDDADLSLSESLDVIKSFIGRRLRLDQHSEVNPETNKVGLGVTYLAV